MNAVSASFTGLLLPFIFSTNSFCQKEKTPVLYKDVLGNKEVSYAVSLETKNTEISSKQVNKRNKNIHFKPELVAYDSSSTLQYSVRNQNASLKTKFLRGEKLIGGSELLGMGILILLPKKVTKWEDDWMADAMRNLKRSWTNMPVWDKDDWGFNYIGHPLAGALYYNAVRSQNASKLSSFAFATIQSTIWEYVVEGIAERPSIQDLFITPIGGAIFGEATHWMTIKMQRNGFSTAEKIAVLVLNPMYVINNGLKKKYKRIALYK